MPIKRLVNKDYFKVWTSKMAYILGFFAADGYITKNKRGGYFWSFQVTDDDLLNRIKSEIRSTHKIGHRIQRNSKNILYRLQIGSKEMCHDLDNLGMRIKKTKTMDFPTVPDQYLRHFVRGYFDGDGHVWIKKRSNNLVKNFTPVILVGFTSSSKKFIIKLKNKLKELGLIGGSLICRESYFRLQYSIRDSVRIYHIMYDNIGGEIYLDRKKSLFDKYLKDRNAPVV